MASPFGASTLQLGIGAALLLFLAGLSGSLGAFGLLDEAEPWELAGGLGSAIYITSGILLFPRLGAVVTVGLWIAGQMLASLALDGTGWLGVEPDPLGAPELVGVSAALAGATMIVLAQAEGETLRGVLRERSAWLGLALLAGAALPVQGAVNAELRAALDAPIATGALSFLVATAAMALLLAGTLPLAGGSGPQVRSLRTVPWWGWLGGLVGATYVTAVFSLIPEIGAAPTIALTVAGQQLASVFVDRFGLFRLPRRRLSALRLVALAALLAGMVLIQVG